MNIKRSERIILKRGGGVRKKVGGRGGGIR